MNTVADAAANSSTRFATRCYSWPEGSFSAVHPRHGANRLPELPRLLTGYGVKKFKQEKDRYRKLVRLLVVEPSPPPLPHSHILVFSSIVRRLRGLCQYQNLSVHLILSKVLIYRGKMFGLTVNVCVFPPYRI
jgi:hypothetical protein